MSIKKDVLIYDEETGVVLKDSSVVIEDIKVSFKIGSRSGAKQSRYSKVFHLEDPNFEVSSFYSYFYKCLLHLEMSSNRIVFHTHISEPNKPIDEVDMENLFQCSDKTVKKFINFCINKNIMARIDKNGKLFGYVINPIYALNGNRITSNLYLIFGENGELDEYIPKRELSMLKQYLKIKPFEEKIFQLKK